ncbi:sugar transferase [Gilvimarinus sp. SDUM040013]|uniref:Sugar transferase n=1 Tax=Gilvimarinus gilvus TaxID=3058038 RepID=A0ABU4RTK8_9GAMM|nr:sugar transferase [Gilvimarinus sp. SDUM040013]MDO3386850.1 sugar transferase [Gilvimarinus sp. SDUM040013]MDX6848220.1 sugar transferase [Gilvimarinus sp. SDUM040013]
MLAQSLEKNTKRTDPPAKGTRKLRSALDWLLEKLLAVLLLVLSSPLFIVLPLLIKLQDGGPAFYRGDRLGRHKETFQMYKFRTLVPDAESQLGAQLLNHQHQLHTPLGKFLRDVRVDELPQLYNVLRGDMAFFGPRPERQAVYEAQCAQIPGYDKRFAVKPGVLGYSQLFTPHSAPKRMRATIDNNYGQREQGLLHELGVVIYAFSHLSFGLVKRASRSVLKRCVMFRHAGKTRERRRLKRVSPVGVEVALFTDVHAMKRQRLGKVVLGDISDEWTRVYCDQPLPEEPLVLQLRIDTSARRSRNATDKPKTTYCRASVVRQLERPGHTGQYTYLLKYEPTSPLNRYLLDKYFIAKSIF